MHANEDIYYASEAKRTPSLTSSEEEATRRNMDNFSLDAANVGRRTLNSNGKQKRPSTRTHKLCNISEDYVDADQKGQRRFKAADESSAATMHIKSSSPYATQSQVEVCPSPENTRRGRMNMEGNRHHNDVRMPTNVAVLKMLLLSAAMAFLSVGAFAIKMKGELMDLKAEYDSLNGIQSMKSPSYADNSSTSISTSTVNLKPSELHAFDDGMEDIMQFNHDFEKPTTSTSNQDLIFQLTSENHHLRSQLYNTTSFLHLAVHVIKGLKRYNEEVKEENDFVYTLVHKNAEDREECTEKLNKLSGEMVELEKELNAVKSDRDDEIEMVHNEVGIEVQNLEQQLKLMTEKFDEKETELVSENHKLRWNMYNTTSFLHLAIYVITLLKGDYASVMDENDFVYELLQKMTKERADFHEKIEKLTEEKAELEQELLVHEKAKEEDNMSVMEAEVRHDEVGSVSASSTSTSESESTTKTEILLRLEHELHENESLHNQLRTLRRQLYLTTSTIHLGMWYIHEMGEFYEDMNEQVDILYELNDEMGDELNRTRECLKVHPNPQWDEVNVEEGKVSESESFPVPGPVPQNVPVDTNTNTNTRDGQKEEE